MKDIVPIWIPSTVGGDRLRSLVAPGSAIVGPWHQYVGRSRLWIEGNIYGFDDMRRFVQRCYHAWDRMDQHYPTVAVVAVSLYEVQEVGEFDPNAKIVTLEPLDEDKVVEWLGIDVADWPNVRQKELVL